MMTDDLSCPFLLMIARHDPVELRGDHARERDFGRGDLALQLILRPAEPRIHEGTQIIFQLRIARQNREDVLVAFVQELDGVRKGAVPSPVVDAQEPDHGGEEDDRAFDEEIALLLHPCLVQVQHDGIGALVGVRDVVHKGGVDRVAAVRATRVVEIDDVEGRYLLVAFLVHQQVVVGDLREVGKLEVVDVHRVPLFDLLLDELIDDGVALARPRNADADTGSLRHYDVGEAVVPPLVIVEPRR